MCSMQGRYCYREPYIVFPRTLKSGRKVYYCQFRKEDGTRSAGRSLGTTNRVEAERRARKLWREGFFEEEGRYKSPLFKDFAKGFFDPSSEFVQWKEATGKKLAPSTLSFYRTSLVKRVMPYFGNIRLADITSAKIKSWILKSKEEDAAETTNRAIAVLSLILKAAVEKGHIQSNPASGLGRRKVERKERELLTVEEISAIYHSEWPNESAKRLFLVLAITGLRIGEAVGLLSKNVFPDRLNIENSMHPAFGLGPTKTRERRVVPIPSSLNLLSYCGSKWAFQKEQEEKPVSASIIYNRLMRICTSLGIDTKKRGITVHSLRNFFISYMRSSSYGSAIDLKIKAVVGHTDSSMTDWYTYWKPEAFTEIYELQEELLKKILG